MTLELHKAAEQGNVDAQLALGDMYHNGEGGVLQDYKEAEKWYRKAAEQGYAEAQLTLGAMHFVQDYVQAHLWWSLAATQGNEHAIQARDLIAKRMTPAQIAEAQELASNWKPKKP